ncbi:DUF6069 family protein [Streptomyces sp. NBC_00996]|uniref:DUF6069 family protein n=1 Tax=Streptomyces sp. NBC_00996 TaxID=2903710 RepID=UPI003867B25B|nr:DUF6069 family protein [Streptomyces sp. NBC_00996]
MASTNPAATHTVQGRRGLPAWQAVICAAVIAAVANVIVLIIGDAAGASLVLELNGKPDEIGAADVIIVSVLAPAVGVTAAVLLARWRPGFLRVAQILAAAVAVVSLVGPLTLETDGGTATTIAVMHLLVGGIAIAALEAIRRSRG